MTPPPVIRSEQPQDAAAIRCVLEAAFPQPDEANLVDQLRANGGITLSLVAESVDAGIVGHILFSPLNVHADDGTEFSAQALAPLAVAPTHQKQGIGAALVEAGLAALREMGEALVFVLGDPSYYGRFGFVAAAPLGFTSVYTDGEGEHPYFTVLTLTEGALDGKRGRLAYRAEFAGLA